MFSRSAWMTLLSAGADPGAQPGLGRRGRAPRAAGAERRVPKHALPISGTYDATTQAAIRAWQAKNGIGENGVVGPASWAALQAGNR